MTDAHLGESGIVPVLGIDRAAREHELTGYELGRGVPPKHEDLETVGAVAHQDHGGGFADRNLFCHL